MKFQLKLDSHSQRTLHLKFQDSVVPLDSLAELIVDIHCRLHDERYSNLCDIYDASDLNGNGAMDYNEFKLLQSLFMPEKVNMKRIFDQFKDQDSGCLNKK